MSTQLLATKLFIPSQRPELVPRPRLIERLNDGIRLGHKLTLVSAPAGFGKTTLVAAWLRGRDRPSAWLSLDKGDNDPVRFFAYLLAALQKVDPDIGHTAQAMLRAPQPPSLEPLLTTLINDIAEKPRTFISVLDDYHAINAESIHDAMAFLLENLPPQMHLVIATRADPPVPIARFRGRGQLSELYQSDLRFTFAESAEFLNQVMGLMLTVEDVGALEKRTEGWIAGLQLAAVSMQGRDDTAAFVRAFIGSHHYVLDYLGEEVLRQQPARVQSFLLQTAVLDRLTGSLCDAVVGIDESTGAQTDGLLIRSSADPVTVLGTGSQAMLEFLERRNLFIVPLDDGRTWYRYHRLFADLLHHHLQRERRDLVPELHRRASEWYEENGLIPEAVSHALASGDLERAADLIQWIAWLVLTRGEMTTVSGWLDALPPELVHSHPQLGILHAWALALKGELDGVEPILQAVDIQHVEGEAAAVRAYVAGVQGDVPRTIEFAHQALQLSPVEKWFARGLVALSLGIAYWSSGKPVAASRALTEAITFSRAAEQRYLTLFATASLGHVQEMQGLLRQAVETFREAMELATESGHRPVPFAGMAYVGIALVLYHWNDLDGAMRYVTEGIRLSELGGRVSFVLAGRIILALVHQARGDVDKAFEVIRGAKRLAHRHGHTYVMAEISELRIRLWVAQGNDAAALRWAREHRLSSVEELSPTLVCEMEQIAVARVLIAQKLSPTRDALGRAGMPQADDIDEALRFLAKLLEAAEALQRMGSVIKILPLQALAFQARGDVDQALSALERALALAEPEGYVRSFVDEGEPMARLLRRALEVGIAPNYVSRLLAAFGETVEPATTASQPLIEPLSERELEVLGLVAAGLSNREIARELFIAVSTVKSHNNHIYGKLGVKNRTQAVARAQTLGLL